MRLIRRKAESEKSPEQQALEARIDAMMDPKRPEAETPPEVLEPPKEQPKPSATPAPAAADVKTAPRLSASMRKQIAVADVGDKPAAETVNKPAKRSKTTAKNDVPEEPAAPEEPEKPAEPDEPEAAETDDAIEHSTDLDDERTDEAVDDIVKYESDVVLAVADATADERSREAQEVIKQGHSAGHRFFSVMLWTLVFLVAVIAIAFFVLLVTGANVSGLK